MFKTRRGPVIFFCEGCCFRTGVDECTGFILCLVGSGLRVEKSGTAPTLLEQYDISLLNKSCTVELWFGPLQIRQCQLTFSSESLNTSYVLLLMFWHDEWYHWSHEHPKYEIHFSIPNHWQFAANDITGSTSIDQYYMNPSWMRGWDRKFSPKDQRLASRGLPTNDKRWLAGKNVSFSSSHE